MIHSKAHLFAPLAYNFFSCSFCCCCLAIKKVDINLAHVISHRITSHLLILALDNNITSIASISHTTKAHALLINHLSSCSSSSRERVSCVLFYFIYSSFLTKPNYFMCLNGKSWMPIRKYTWLSLSLSLSHVHGCHSC